MHVAAPQEVSPRWLRFNEAEVYAGLGRTTLAGLISAGEIRAAKVGRAVRIDRASLDAYMERQVAGGDED